MLLGILLTAGCVTQTERLPYHRYMPPEEESAWDELKQTARSIKTTVSGWFSSEEETPGSLQGWQKAQRQFKQEQQEAFRRLQERQAQEQQQQEELRRELEKQN
jgi:septal ring factor EnvC (AmiA/AmiB activator)